MKMKKTFISLLAVLAIGVGMVGMTSCGGNGGNGGNSDINSESSVLDNVSSEGSFSVEESSEEPVLPE